jgi:hypothetical protein
MSPQANAFCVPVLYLTSAVVAFLSFLSESEMNNLRSFNAADGSIPTAPTKSPDDSVDLGSPTPQEQPTRSPILDRNWTELLSEFLKILQRQPRIATTKLCVQDFLHCQPHFLACVLPFEPFVILIGD